MKFFGERSPIAYSDPRVIALLRVLEATWNPNEVDRFYRQLWPIFQEDLPLTFLSPVVWTGVAHRRIKGLRKNRLAELALRFAPDLSAND